MAFAVADGVMQVKGAKANVKSVSKASLQDLQEADGIIIGSPTYYGQVSGELKAFIDRSVEVHGNLEGKVGAAFASSGGNASGVETTLLSILEAMLIHGMIIQGRSDHSHYGSAAVGAPDANATQDCRDLGRRVASLAARLKE